MLSTPSGAHKVHVWSLDSVMYVLNAALNFSRIFLLFFFCQNEIITGFSVSDVLSFRSLPVVEVCHCVFICHIEFFIFNI